MTSPIRKLTCGIRAKVLMPTIKKHIKRKDRVLDVGCDTGIVTNHIKKSIGCEIKGTDKKNVLENDIPFSTHYIAGTHNKILLIDVLHHIPRNKQLSTIKHWEKYGEVIIIETEPNLVAHFVDFMNEKRGMVTPYAFRKQVGWQRLLHDYKVKRIKTPCWYPLKHLVITK